MFIRVRSLLLAGVAHHRFHYTVEVEAAGLLPWRKLLEALQPLRDKCARGCEDEPVVGKPSLIVHADVLRELERIHAQVVDHGGAQRCEGLLPDVQAVGLIESELFGHEKGSFTGAERSRQGRFELAEGGILFLDEIGELPLEIQAKLLRVLQEGEFDRVGGTQTRKANVRLIAATNRSLRQEVAAGRFRDDLYFRLMVFPITVPPLRDRRGDIPLLVEHLTKKLNRKQGRHISEIPMKAVQTLTANDWPGNVRELENVIERAVITSRTETLALPDDFVVQPVAPRGASNEPLLTLDEVERNYIRLVLQHTRGRISAKRAPLRSWACTRIRSGAG
jgi:transcriptional regulator of acetoin/glycerol metabolism